MTRTRESLTVRNMTIDEFSGLSPINFFRMKGEIFHLGSGDSVEEERYLLPPTAKLLGEPSPFASLHMGWSLEGLHLYMATRGQPYHRSFYPDIDKGDSLELFIDTRDIKSSGYNTRFCHHFYFLPEAVEGHLAGEITRFRTEERHHHSDPSLLKVSAKLKKDCYSMKIFIPSECLTGYDPEQLGRIGFSYRVNRPGEPPQHFSATGDEYKIEEQPSLWSSMRLAQ